MKKTGSRSRTQVPAPVHRPAAARDPRSVSLPAPGGPAPSRRAAHGPAPACPAPPTLGAPRLVPCAARLPPAGALAEPPKKPKRREGGKKGGCWGKSLPRPAARALASPPSAAAPPLTPGPGPLPRRAPGAPRTLAARLRRRNHGGGAAEAAAAAASALPRPGTPPPAPPPPPSSASSPPEAPRDSGSPGPRPGARAPNLAALAARRARPALTHRR